MRFCNWSFSNARNLVFKAMFSHNKLPLKKKGRKREFFRPVKTETDYDSTQCSKDSYLILTNNFTKNVMKEMFHNKTAHYRNSENVVLGQINIECIVSLVANH